jgi:hypothetical protein
MGHQHCREQATPGRNWPFTKARHHSIRSDPGTIPKLTAELGSGRKPENRRGLLVKCAASPSSRHLAPHAASLNAALMR